LARSATESVRSHYTCSDIERLFNIQPRSAQKLMNLLPTVRIGKSQLVEREALASFLGRLAEAEDPGSALAAIRAEGKPPVVRRKLRELVQRDLSADASSLPPNVHLEPGTLAISFTTVEELAASLWSLATLLEEDLEGFAERYESLAEVDTGESAEKEAEQADAAYIREWLAEQS
jgi:hypothetical protein